jgi:UDP-3-O-[3-hydroxymyristoyl] N-acetylglucosamine deacetylase
MKGAKQTTLRHPVAVSGIGVHSGLPVTLTLHPADDDSGIVFQRIAADGSIEREIRADVRAVTATEFATVLGDAKGPLCSTAEHLLAALRGLYVDNVVVEIDGPEVPIMDGSAAAFVDAIDQAGLTARALPRRYIEVLKPVTVSKDGAVGELRPYQHGFRVEAEIDFDHPLIGQQALALDIEPDTFRREIARARTFGFMRDVSKLWSAGLAHRSRTRWSSAKTAYLTRMACVLPTSSCGTRFWMQLVTWRSPVSRSSRPTRPSAAATSSITRCCPR